MNNVIYEFDCAIYPRKLWVCYNCSIDVQRDLFGECLQELDIISYADTTEVVRQTPDKKGGVLIRFGSKADMRADIMAHEAVHAAFTIFDYCRCETTVHDQEPFAYLIGWIVDCCQQVKTGKFKNLATQEITTEKLSEE